jgi:hypothetical protein
LPQVSRGIRSFFAVEARTHHLSKVADIALLDLGEEVEVIAIVDMIPYGGIPTHKCHIALLSFPRIEEESISRPPIRIAMLFAALTRKQQDQWVR